MSKITRFIKTSAIYFLGSVLSKVIGILLLPLYTSQFTPEEFGYFDFIVTIISFFAPIAFFQIWDGMFRFSFDKDSTFDKYIIISNSMSVFICGMFIYIFFSVMSFIELQYENSILIILYGLFISIQYQYTFVTRAFLKNKLFIFTGLLNSLINAGSNIIFILIFGFGIESLFLSSILGILAQVIIIEIKLQPIKNFRFTHLNLKLQIDMIKFSIPLCIAAVTYWLLSGYTKVTISQQLGYFANGLYAIANKFTAMLTMIVSVFQFAWNEMAYVMTKDMDRFNNYKKSINYIFKVVILGSSIFMLIIKLIFPYFIDHSYQDALLIIPLSIFGVAASSFSNFLGTIFMAEKKTRLIFWTTVFASLINVISSTVFTLLWDLQGAVGALCLSFFALGLIRIYSAMKTFNIRIELKNYSYLLTIPISVYIFCKIENPMWLAVSISILIAFSIYSIKEVFFNLLLIKLKK